MGETGVPLDLLLLPISLGFHLPSPFLSTVSPSAVLGDVLRNLRNFLAAFGLLVSLISPPFQCQPATGSDGQPALGTDERCPWVLRTLSSPALSCPA